MLLPIVETGVPIVAFLLMVAVGLDVTREDIRRVAGRGWMVAGLTIAQVVFIPIAAWLLVPTIVDERISGFVLLVAACPGGGMSNVYVYLARANTALSVTLTAISSMAAVVTMPVVFAAYAAAAGDEHEFALPLPTLIAQLLVMTVIPVALGAWIRDRHPEVERRHGGRLRAAAAAGVAVIVVIGLLQS